MVLSQVISIGPKFLYKYVQSAYWPHDSDIVREMEVLGNTRTSCRDPEAQRHEDLPLVHPQSATSPTGEGNSRSRTFSGESTLQSPSDDLHSPFRRVPSSSNDYGAPPPPSSSLHAASSPGIPIINVHSLTPRGSTTSEAFDTTDYYGARPDEWQYAQVPSQTTIDLHSSSPLDEHARAYRAQQRQAQQQHQQQQQQQASWDAQQQYDQRGGGPPPGAGYAM